MTFKLTDEQQHVLDLFKTSDSLICSALAGAGKTATLMAMAEDNPRFQFGYLAFGKAIVADVLGRAPANVEVRTIHSLAWNMHARPWVGRLNDNRRAAPNSIAKVLNTTPMSFVDTPRGRKVLGAAFLASLAYKTIDRFCQSSTPEPTQRHVPIVPGLDAPGTYTNNRVLAGRLMPYVHAAWEDLQHDDASEKGRLRFSFQHYLKLYQLSLAAWDGHADEKHKGVRRRVMQKHVIMVDECFPPGTPVMTPDGEAPIESFGPGDSVLCASDDGTLTQATVTTSYRTPRKGHLVRIRFSSGQSLTCTGNHPIRVGREWVPAALLAPGDPVLRVLGAVFPDESQRAQSVLFAPVSTSSPQAWLGALHGHHESGSGQTQTSHARGRRCASEVPADARSRVATESHGHLESDGPPAEGTRGEREADAGGSARVAGRDDRLDGLGLEARACRPDQSRPPVGVPLLLQARRGSGSVEVGLGGRWGQSPHGQPQAAGHQEGFLPVVDRVDGVEVLELADPGRPGCRDELCHVYTLSTTSGRYIAGGVVVKNCQDVAPVMMDIVERHDHAKFVGVGDEFQAIFGFTGAINAIKKFKARGIPEATLTGCFRFGPEIAEAGNYVLDELGAPIRMRGLGKPGRIGLFEEYPVTVLCRTNGGAMGVMASALDVGLTPAFTAQRLRDDLANFCKAADKLKNGQSTDHHDLGAFGSWAEVQDYVANDPMGSDLAVFVKIIDQYGPMPLLARLDKCGDEQTAQVCISTAHGGKGRQWPNVRLHTDYPAPGARMLEDEDLRLVYVAVTRAQTQLDIEAVDYFDDFLGMRRAQRVLDAIVDQPLPEGMIEGEELGFIDPELPAAPLPLAAAESEVEAKWPRVWH